ncbi:hypothetical protein HY641_03165 [Candidatus Woesearchaeota archaeon]|nr:hypothetical protein [Candidatus Woesearchaeota archaeon]
MNKDQWQTGWGLILISFFLLGVWAMYTNNAIIHVLWLCNHTALVMGIALLLRRPGVLAGEVSLFLIPQILWSVDFLSVMLTGHSPLGTVVYMFDPMYPISMYILGLSHLILAPLTIVILFGSEWKPSFAASTIVPHVLALWVVSAMIGPMLNLNCYARPCSPVLPDAGYWWYGSILLLAMALGVNALLIWACKKVG